MLDGVSLFTASIRDQEVSASDPRVVKPVSQSAYAVTLLHKIYAYIKAYEQVLLSIKSQRDLQSFELYMESAYINTQQ